MAITAHTFRLYPDCSRAHGKGTLLADGRPGFQFRLRIWSLSFWILDFHFSKWSSHSKCLFWMKSVLEQTVLTLNQCKSVFLLLVVRAGITLPPPLQMCTQPDGISPLYDLPSKWQCVICNKIWSKASPSFKKWFIFYLLNYVKVCMGVWRWMASEARGIRSSGAGITVGNKPPV